MVYEQRSELRIMQQNAERSLSRPSKVVSILDDRECLTQSGLTIPLNVLARVGRVIK
jgi:hypothetical protein